MLARAALAALVGVWSAFAAERDGYSVDPDALLRESSDPVAALYAFDPNVPLEKRAYPCPEHLLDRLRLLDRRPDYTAHVPTAAERKLVARVLSGLPPRMRAILSRRLLGVYFVDGFATNGLSAYESDAGGREHPYIVVNPAAFSRTLSDTLTARERSAFAGKSDLRFDWGPASGAEYILVHEAAHAYDYVARLTPCVSPPHAKQVDAAQDGKCIEQPWDAWKDYWTPADVDALPRRERLIFYGLSGEPELASEDVPRMLAALESSPFASLYGAQHRAEDAAELITFYHLTRKLGRPAVISAGGREYRPMRGPALERAARIYRELEGFAPASAARRSRPR